MFARKLETSVFISALFHGVLKREPEKQEMTYWTNQLAAGLAPAEFVKLLVNCAEANPAPAAKLFCPPGHFYSPVVDRAEAERHFAAAEAKGVPDALPGIAIERNDMARFWMDLVPFLKSAPFSETASAGLRYGYDNPNYAWGDGSVLHAMIARHRPEKIIEIGSGWSSVCALDTVEKCLRLPCELTFIEPYPQLLFELAGESAKAIKVIECGVQNAPLNVFDRLQKNDILFIDSTHVLRTGSDVCFELFEILPRLASGVLVHVHDMFWPFEYPRAWAIEENRSWNELYAIRAFLTNNPDWEIIFFNDFFVRFERPLIESTWPPFLRNSGGALWLRRR
jgi:hypothetical protein